MRKINSEARGSHGCTQISLIARIWYSILLGSAMLVIVGVIPYRWMTVGFSWKYVNGVILFGVLALYSYGKLIGLRSLDEEKACRMRDIGYGQQEDYLETGKSEVMIATDKEMVGMLDVMSISDEVAPIYRQMHEGVGYREVPEGGVFDPYIRAYVLGYVDALLKIKHSGGIDVSPDLALKVFRVMFGGGLGFGEDDGGLQMLNECLVERGNAGSGSETALFTRGFLAGQSDYAMFNAGGNPESLSLYIESKLASL